MAINYIPNNSLSYLTFLSPIKSKRLFVYFKQQNRKRRTKAYKDFHVKLICTDVRREFVERRQWAILSVLIQNFNPMHMPSSLLFNNR